MIPVSFSSKLISALIAYALAKGFYSPTQAKLARRVLRRRHGAA